ncbi:MAG: DUF5331 domain-containing protein [Plectolyngbya sp. WJT66-NPBG17]|nr:DUF5331 domain-containing protein [Plectolyngbya sp. WJT66-NPBG17]MBW4525237.1 DUF5331 domain-containing protein [Phormidium tanganyikae FI6-MK23]
MNIDQLRRSLKDRWLDYYQENRSWITRLSIWVSCEGKRRPSSSFILGALSTVEPRLVDLLPLIVDLSNHPDRIVVALGLNFDPEQELIHLKQLKAESESPKYLPASSVPEVKPSRPAEVDEACEGRDRTSKIDRSPR